MSSGDNHPVIQVSVDEVEHNWSTFIRRVEAGETLVIIKGGKSIAEIKPSPLSSNHLRPYGLCAGEFIVPDDFDAPLR